jgi:hypothetical protein
VLRRAKDSLSNGAVVRDANGRVGQVVEDDRVPEQPDTAFRRASRERRTHIRVGWIEEDQDPQARARAGAAATPTLTTPQLDIITFALLWYLRGRGRSAIPSLWTNSWPGDVLPYFGLVESQNRICQHTSINTLFKTGVYMYTEVLDTCKAWLDNPLFRAAGLRALSSTASPCPLTAVPRPACPPLSVALAAAAAQSPLAASLAVIQQRKSFSGVVIQLGLI